MSMAVDPKFERRGGVLVIYTGGTIGSKPNQPDDPDSPQRVVSWAELRASMPEVDRVGFRVDCISLPTPLDSCNVGPEEWIFMARAIVDNYDDYNGFVILHGTDTLAYSAAVLSFMLKNLSKPVVITGAQRSALVDVRNDASQNFITALRVAEHEKEGIPLVPEVCVCFGDGLYRGNCTVKQDTAGFNAYTSPNVEQIGEVGDRIIINPRIVRPVPSQPLQPRLRLDTNVLPIFISPGIQDTEMVERQLLTPNLRAAVVMAFGSGNIPTDPKFLELFREAHERGIILANVSQCRRGPVELGIYETSAALLDAGFIAASDLSYEAAICKLMVLLGQPDRTRDELEIEYQQAVAGEQSESLHVTRFPVEGDAVATGVEGGQHRVRGVPIEGQWAPSRIERALLRLRSATFTVADGGAKAATSGESLRVNAPGGQDIVDDFGDPVDIRIFVNLDPDEAPLESSPKFAGSFRRYANLGDGSLLVLDIAGAVRSTVRSGERVSVTMFVDTPGATVSWKQTELALFVRESIE